MKLLYPLAKRFIAGDDFDSAKRSIEVLMDDGYQVSIDYIGENSKTIKQCKKAYNQYQEIIKYFKNKIIDISIKPSQLGLSMHPYLAYTFLIRLARSAFENGHTIRLDMEDSSTTEFTYNLATLLNKRYGNVGVAVQANLFRSIDDLPLLIKSKVSVRLVKGAYKESKKIAYRKERDVFGNFIDCVGVLFEDSAKRPAIATHDEDLLDDIELFYPDHKFYFDYELLYGIRRDLQKKLKKDGKVVRIYVPFGTAWLPYTLRRLKNWKNLKFVIKSIFKEGFS